MKIPNYPNDFHYYDRDRRLSEDDISKRINIEIEEMIYEMEKYGYNNMSTSFEDILIFVDRVKDDSGDKYEISIAEKHKSAFVR